MKNFLSIVSLAALLAGCSSGSTELSAKDDATAQSGFSRPLTDAEKAQMGKGNGAPAGPDPASKRPAGG
ncbi:hypothetical protein EON82_03060 [bacterium]|nr:MAG: hypothetical protein EON82_03060 [bacterium]